MFVNTQEAGQVLVACASFAKLPCHKSRSNVTISTDGRLSFNRGPVQEKATAALPG